MTDPTSTESSRGRKVMFRGSAQIIWEEYEREQATIPRFPEWEAAIRRMVLTVGRRDYIPKVSMHITDAKTRNLYGVSVVYVLNEGIDYILFYYEKETIVVFFMSKPFEERLSTAFTDIH